MFINGRRRNGGYDAIMSLVWECPYCQQIFLAGVVTIKGERYKCTHCNCWFKEENERFVQVEYIEVGKL